MLIRQLGTTGNFAGRFSSPRGQRHAHARHSRRQQTIDSRRLLVVVGSLTLIASMRLSAQSILTIAGGGTDDGRPATVAGLYGPSGVAVDAEGNLYIADTSSHRVRKVAARNGIITTVAGNGSRGFTGDGNAATLAGVAYPQSVAVDSGGNLYIAADDRIRKVAAGSGIITTVAGNGSGEFSGDGGPATAAGLYGALGVAVDLRGNLYIADSESSRIRKVSADSGIITTIAGTGAFEFSGDGGPAIRAGLARPYGVALDSTGNLYIADFENARIRRVAAGSGTITTIAGNGSDGFSGDGHSATAAALWLPSGVALDAEGNLYISDLGNARIRRVATETGIITTVAGNGSSEFSGDGGAATAAGIRAPVGVALDLAGNIYVVDFYNSRIRKIESRSGTITTVAGNGSEGFTGDGAPATAAQLDFPDGVAGDSAGNLYVADYARIRKVAAGTGIITTVAGNGSGGFSGDGGAATMASLAGPKGIRVDSAGNIYIADTGNHRIRRISAVDGIITTVAGNVFSPDGLRGGFSGDGGAATVAALFDPYGVALDSSGNVYIADTINNRIRKVAADTGIITTVAGNGS